MPHSINTKTYTHFALTHTLPSSNKIYPYTTLFVSYHSVVRLKNMSNPSHACMLRLIASGSRLLLMRLTPRINRDTNIRCYLNRVVPFPGSPPSNRLCVFLIDSTIRISGRCDVGSDETFYNYQLCNSDKLTLVSITYKHTTHGHGSNFTLPN